MAYRWWLPLIFVMFLAGCQGEPGNLIGSSWNEISGDSLSLPDDAARLMSLSELIDDPENFVGDQLSLSGDLSPAPVTYCRSKARRFPANWILSDGENEVPVASTSSDLDGFVDQISGAVLTGRWLHWQGPVGCGPEVGVEEQWFLDVSHFTSPNPVALVPVLSPSPGVNPEQPAQEEGILGTGEPSDLLVSPIPTSVSEHQISETGTPGPQEMVMTPTSTVVPTPVTMTITTTPTPAEDGEPSLLTATPTLETPELSTATPTLPPATPTAVETGASSPSATATESPLQTIFRMALDVSSIETGRLGTGEIHRWTYEITSTERLTVNLASDYLLDVTVSVVDPDGQTIAQQNNASNGEPEILSGVTLMNPGVYDILVSSPTGEPGNYSILVSNEESYSYIFQGTLQIGDGRTATAAAENDHFWHFTGSAGQAVTIVVIPTGDSDLFLNLFDTHGVPLIRFHNETSSGEPEQIINYVLPESGIYPLRVGEFNYNPYEYEIFLTDG